MEAWRISRDGGRVAVAAWRRAVLGGLLAAAVATAGCGGDDGNGDGPSSADVPDGAVAVVEDEEISERELDGQVQALRRATSRGGGTKPDREQLEQQALTVLLQTRWLEQEARKRGIEVDMADVRSRWRSAAADQFPTKKALRRFLGGQAQADLLRQLRLQELTERIHEQIRAEADGNPKRAVRQFQRRFQERVREASACADGFSAAGCDDD